MFHNNDSDEQGVVCGNFIHSRASEGLTVNETSLCLDKTNDTSSSQVELYCHSATCRDIQWNEMSCLTGPWCYINTDMQP